MSKKEEITKGVAAHGLWKQRIQSAIETGKSDWTPEKVVTDNNCEFGKWLHSTPSGEQGDHWGKVKDLHADFHKVAAHVLTLALDGKKDEAEGEIALNSKYRTISSALTREMMAWGKDEAA